MSFHLSHVLWGKPNFLTLHACWENVQHACTYCAVDVGAILEPGAGRESGDEGRYGEKNVLTNVKIIISHAKNAIQVLQHLYNSSLSTLAPVN